MKKSMMKSLIAIIISVLVLGGAIAVLVVVLNKPKVNDILLDTTSTQKVFMQGEDFNYDGLKVFVRHDDGSKKEIKDYSVDKSAFDSSKIASYEIKVNYKGATDKYTVKVIDSKTVKEIMAVSIPKMFKGQSLIDSDLVIKVKYINGDEEIVTDYTIKSFDSTTAGEKQAIIKYTDKELEFNVTVLNNADYVNYVFDSLNKDAVSSFKLEYPDNHKMFYIHANGLYSKEINGTMTYEDWLQDGYFFSSVKEPGHSTTSKIAETLKEFFTENVYDTNVGYAYNEGLDFVNNMYNSVNKTMQYSLTNNAWIETGLQIEYKPGNLTFKVQSEDDNSYTFYTIENGQVAYLEDHGLDSSGEYTDKIKFSVNASYDVPTFNPDDFILEGE